MSVNSLKPELSTFRRVEGKYRDAHSGEYLVVKMDGVLGPFATYSEALEAGYAAHGPTAFLVKPIDEQPGFIPSLQSFDWPEN